MKDCVLPAKHLPHRKVLGRIISFAGPLGFFGGNLGWEFGALPKGAVPGGELEVVSWEEGFRHGAVVGNCQDGSRGWVDVQQLRTGSDAVTKSVPAMGTQGPVEVVLVILFVTTGAFFRNQTVCGQGDTETLQQLILLVVVVGGIKALGNPELPVLGVRSNLRMIEALDGQDRTSGRLQERAPPGCALPCRGGQCRQAPCS